MSTFTATKIYKGQPPVATGTLYTVATGASIIIREVVLVNTTAASAANITMYLVDTGGTASVDNLIINNQTIATGDSLFLDMHEVLEASGIIQAAQDTTGAITAHIAGVVIT